MCLISFAYQPNAAHQLILSANRDEYFERPSQNMHWWVGSDMLAGKDLRDGGSWLGITRGGRFAAVTNYRESVAQSGTQKRHSRGHLVSDFLQGTQSPAAFSEALQPVSGDYAGFNLLLFDGEEFLCTSNRAGDKDATIRLAPGTYGLSNHLLDSPWPKVDSAKAQLSEAIKAEVEHGQLLELMRDTHTPADASLPDTGIGIEMERLLGSRFINTEGYGTRSTASMIWNSNGQISIAELTYLADGNIDQRVDFDFELV